MASRKSETILREDQVDDDCRNNRRSSNHNNNYRSTSAARKEGLSSKIHHDQPQKAPLVGWQNGSPTICSNPIVRGDLDDVGPYSRGFNLRQPSLDSTQEEPHDTAIELFESNAPIKTSEQSGALNNIQESLIYRKNHDKTVRNTGATANQLQVKKSGDCETISEREEDSSDTSTKEKQKEKPKVPDGGWGWVVVVASIIISMVADGISFSFGLLYIEFLHEFGESKSKTAWIGSLFMAVPLLSGPVMSALVDRFGCRLMTIVGGLVSGLGFILCIFSNTIEIMYLTFGVIAGLGLGLCYVTAVVSIAFWFDKKRTLAVGLGACGTGIGTFVYAPMTTYFINEYGWRGTCLLLAGTFFNMIVAGAVMRDPEWWILEQRKHHNQTAKKSNAARSDGVKPDGSPLNEFPGVEELRKLLRSEHAPEYLLQNFSTSTEATDGAKRRTTSVVNLPTFVKCSEKVPLEVLESLLSNSKLYNVILENYPSLLLCRSVSDKHLNGRDSIHNSMGEICTNKSGVTMSMRLKRASEPRTITEQRKDSCPSSIQASTKPVRRTSRKETEETNPLLTKEVAHTVTNERRKRLTRRHTTDEPQTNVIRTDSIPWLRRQFSTNTHYFKDIRVHRNSVMYRGASLNLRKYRLRASSCPNIYRNSMITLDKEEEQKWYAELVDLLKGMVDFSMFLEFHFLLMSLSTIMLFTWFIVPYFYLAEHLTRNGYSEADAANLLSIIGITNTIGMIVLGWAGDQPWMNVDKTYAWCLVACGTSTLLMSVFTHYYIYLLITSACFGIFFASSFSFTPVILVELIPLERFTTAYGLTLLCQGIGNLLGPPLAGWFFDITGTWHLSFLMAGGWIIVSGILIGIIPYTKNRKIFGSGPIERERTNDECLA
ncbi:monocarboxylate transporter 14-like isoform X2 [Pseudomyrmex gracilis]|uniref:monocarboxylate transporter 14-like isoform X2 n=1 Tax=Pseudomyrmex gracilis TaxID=219809 RepID=UPI00099555FA|nr:monocarboxylate transporter 14-like isoform X2 [Pseudomyrmex gracilis]